MADPTIAVLGIILTQVNTLTKQGAFIMATVQELQAKVNDLVASAAAREARDVAQDAVTAAQIKSLQDQVTALQALGSTAGLTPEQQAAVDAMIASVQAVITSLDAADPTPPAVVEPPAV